MQVFFRLKNNTSEQFLISKQIFNYRNENEDIEQTFTNVRSINNNIERMLFTEYARKWRQYCVFSFWNWLFIN